MDIDLLTDGHLHTPLCHHAVGEMEEYVVAAIAKGLQKIVFLEHMEEEVRYFRTTWLTEEDFDRYFREGQRLQEKYRDRLSIGLGVEVGYNPLCSEKLLERLSRRQWDRIGVSYHFHHIAAGEDHLNLVSKADARIQQLDLGQKRYIEEQYYTTLIEAVNVLPGTVLCHIDAALRYHPLQDPEQQPWDLVEELLDNLRKNDMSLEINTSGVKVRNECFPTRKILAMALAKGIPLVAGSDAHRPEDVGNLFSTLKGLLSPPAAHFTSRS